MRAGYACICLGNEELRCQRTTILKYARPEKLRELIAANLQGLQRILRFNARQHGHRLSFHASHFTILNSEHEHVVESAVQDVIYMGRVLEPMELGPEHKIVLHGGINSPTVDAAEERLARAFDRIPPEYRRHLVLEMTNGSFPRPASCRSPGAWKCRSWSTCCTTPATRGLAGYLHTELLGHVFATWGQDDGPPKMHFLHAGSGEEDGGARLFGSIPRDWPASSTKHSL